MEVRLWQKRLSFSGRQADPILIRQGEPTEKQERTMMSMVSRQNSRRCSNTRKGSGRCLLLLKAIRSR